MRTDLKEDPSLTKFVITQIGFRFLILAVTITALGLVATPFVYRYSQEQTAREVEAASYRPPPNVPIADDTKPKPGESLNAWLSRTQLEKAKKRVEQVSPKPVAPVSVTVSEPLDTSLADAHDDREPPSTNPFGQPIDADGNLVDEHGNRLPDPCAAALEFDFTEPYWQSVCADNGIPAERCVEVLTTEHGIGSDEIHYEFALPEGCRP